MKVTLNWLKQYVDFDWSPEQLAERANHTMWHHLDFRAVSKTA